MPALILLSGGSNLHFTPELAPAPIASYVGLAQSLGSQPPDFLKICNASLVDLEFFLGGATSLIILLIICPLNEKLDGSRFQFIHPPSYFTTHIMCTQSTLLSKSHKCIQSHLTEVQRAMEGRTGQLVSDQGQVQISISVKIL